MRKLLQGSANLEFWETYNSQEVAPYLAQLDQRLANGDSKSDATAKDSTKAAKPNKEAKLTLNAGKNSATSTESAALAAAKKQHPLLSMLQTVPGEGLSLVGYANVRDTAAINKLIHSQLAKQVLPSNLKLLWSAKPAEGLQHCTP